MSSSNNSRNLIKAAGAMSAATLISRVLGLVREQVFAILFGAGAAMDAFVVAYKIPNLFRDLFAEGAMNAALVPTFVRLRESEGQKRAWRLAGLVFRLLVVLLGILVMLGIFFSPSLVELYASAFHQVEGKFEMTVSLTRIMFPYLLFVALAAAFMGVLNSSGVFFIPALASALFNFTSIASGIALSALMPRWGFHPIEGMAYGVLLGGIVQFACQYPSLKKLGYRWEPRQGSEPSWHQEPALKSMAGLMIPVLLSSAAVQINVLVNNVLATSQGDGAVSWLNYAFRLFQFPIGVFGVALATASLPTLSRMWANRQELEVKETLENTLLLTFAITLPSFVGLAVIARPLIDLVFQYGRFTPDDAQNTALALMGYASGICSYSFVKILVPACYAMGSPRIPVFSSLLSVATNLLINLQFVKWFGFWGLALGTSIAVTLNAGFLLVAIQWRLKSVSQRLSWRRILGGLLRYVLLSALMGASVAGAYQGMEILTATWDLPLALLRLLRITPCLALGVVIYAALGYFSRSSEILEIASILKNKLKK